MESNKNNDIEKKANGKNSRKRGVLTVIFVLLMALSMACFYGAYNVLYGDGGIAMTTEQPSDESTDIDTAKVSENQSAEADEAAEDEASSESEENDADEAEAAEAGKSSKKSSQPKQQVIEISITGWGSKTMVYESGDTVYSVLARCGAPAYVEDTVYGLYVVGINGLMEGDKGASSGWTYTVNGSMPMMSAEKCKVKPGDTIVWNFVS